MNFPDIKNSIESVVFDFGGVLINWNPTFLDKKLFSLEKDMPFFLKNILKREWYEKQNKDKNLIDKNMVYEEYIKIYYGKWNEMLKNCIPESVEVLSKLYNDKKYKLYGLTNWSRETFPKAKETFPFFNFFEDIIISGEVLLQKPDPRIFNLLFKSFNIIPQHSVYIDDSYVNIKTAKKLGMQTVYFQTPKQFKKELALLISF